MNRVATAIKAEIAERARRVRELEAIAKAAQDRARAVKATIRDLEKRVKWAESIPPLDEGPPPVPPRALTAGNGEPSPERGGSLVGRVLAQVQSDPGISAARIASQLGFSPEDVKAALDELKGEGEITRRGRGAFPLMAGTGLGREDAP